MSTRIPAFETGVRLGARQVLMVGNDSDEARVIDNFTRMFTLAAPFGLKLMPEFIPYCQTATVEAKKDDPRAWPMREDPLIEAGLRHAAALALGPVHNLDG